MHSFDKILAYVDYKKVNHEVIKTVQWLDKVYCPSQIIFVTIDDSLYREQLWNDEMGEIGLDSDFIQDSEKDQEEIVLKELKGYDFNTPFIIANLGGNKTEVLLKYIQYKQIDLLLLEGKQVKSGNINKGLLQKNTCSFMLIPEKHFVPPETVLLPFDFSKHSKIALDFVYPILKSRPSIKINVVSSFEVPNVFLKLKETYMDLAYQVNKRKEEAFYDLLSRKGGVGDKESFSLRFEPDVDPSELILSNSENTDLIVMGSKGRSNLNVMFLGSTTQKVIEKVDDNIILVIKKKGENIGLIEALFSM